MKWLNLVLIIMLFLMWYGYNAEYKDIVTYQIELDKSIKIWVDKSVKVNNSQNKGLTDFEKRVSVLESLEVKRIIKNYKKGK